VFSLLLCCRELEQLELVLGLGRIPLCEAGFVPTPHQVGHDKTMHSSWGHSSAAHSAGRGLGVTLPEPPVIRGKHGDQPKLSSEASFRRKLEIHENVQQAIAILANLRGACSVLFEALCKDVRGVCAVNMSALLDLPPTDSHPFTIHHTPAPPVSAPPVPPGAEQPEDGVYVSRRVLRQQAALAKRPVVRINVNESSPVVEEGDGELGMHPFRLLQKITDIACNVSWSRGLWVFCCLLLKSFIAPVPLFL
jgi:hypothetical protein